MRPALRLASRPAEDLPVSTNLPLSADWSQLLLSPNFPDVKIVKPAIVIFLIVKPAIVIFVIATPLIVIFLIAEPVIKIVRIPKNKIVFFLIAQGQNAEKKIKTRKKIVKNAIR